MSTITASQVKELREKTGLGMMKCKKALSETAGDVEKAIELLRKEGAAIAAKRSDREANEGKVLLASTDSCTVALELNCETDFVAASDDFLHFGNTVIEAIKAHNPADIDTIMKIQVDGKTIQDLNTEVMAKLGEKVSIKRFTYDDLGPNQVAETYSHLGGKIGVILKLASDKAIEDTNSLKGLAKDLAMQVAATNPIALNAEGVPQAILAKEKEIYKEQAIKEGKPAEFADKIVQGRLSKFYKENCLYNQVFVKDSKLTVDKLVENTSKELKISDLSIVSYHRLQLGE